MKTIEQPDEKEMALTITEFVLSPDVPPEERKHFERFYILFSKTMATGYIKRPDVLGYLTSFDSIVSLLDMGLYGEARKRQARLLMELQMTRSIEGFYTLYNRGIQRMEYSTKTMTVPGDRKKGMLGRIFRGRSHEEETVSAPPALPPME